MHYYKRHIGDYVTATADLSMLEHGAYAVLLDNYYSRESPLPADHARLYQICKAMTKPERIAVDLVVDRFFDLSDGAYHNHRADEEIAAYQDDADRSRENGKKGGRPRKTQKKPSRLFLGTPEHNPDVTQSITQNEPRNNLNKELRTNNKSPLPPDGGTASPGISQSDLSEIPKLQRWIARRRGQLKFSNPEWALPWIVGAAAKALEVGTEPVALFLSLAADIANGDTSKVGDDRYDAAKKKLREEQSSPDWAEMKGVDSDE